LLRLLLLLYNMVEVRHNGIIEHATITTDGDLLGTTFAASAKFRLYVNATILRVGVLAMKSHSAMFSPLVSP